jgi:hypothetical protein
MSPKIDYSGLLKSYQPMFDPYDDLYKKQSLLQESLQGQKNGLISQREQLPTEYAPSIGGSLISSLAPLVGAFAGGAIGGNVSAPGVMEVGSKYSLAGGQAYFNNLEAHRKQKEDLLSDQMKTLDTQIMYGQRDLAGIESDKLKAQASLGIDYASGKFPGTDPYNIDAASKLNQSLAVANARKGGFGERVPYSLVAATFGDQPELLAAMKDAIDENGTVPKSNLDFVLRKAGIDDKKFNTLLRETVVTGKNTRRPSSAELKDITTMDTFEDEITRLESLIPKIDPSVLKRKVKADFDPNSPEYQYYSLMESAQAAFAMARNKGALSENDMSRYDKLFKGNKLLDDTTSMTERLATIKELNSNLRGKYFGNLKKGGVNVSAWDEETKTGSSTSTASKPSDDLAKTNPEEWKRQYRAWKESQNG